MRRYLVKFGVMRNMTKSFANSSFMTTIPCQIFFCLIVGLVLTKLLCSFKVNLHSWYNVSGILDQLVQVCNLTSFLELIQEIHFQMSQLIADAHVQLVVALG